MWHFNTLGWRGWAALLTLAWLPCGPACSDRVENQPQSERAGTTGEGDDLGGASSTGARPGSAPSAGAGEPARSGGDSNNPPATTAGGAPPDAAGGSDPVGNATDGGNAGDATAPSAGQAGAGGQTETAPAGDSCLTCASGTCQGTIASCTDNPECAPWLACLRSCESAACARGCDQKYADVARVFFGVYSCICAANCGDACSISEACGKKCVDESLIPPSADEPATLAETGLYSSTAASNAAPALAPNVYAYAPKFALWADGAGKDRYIYVPRCASIDTSDMDHWQFPVGTRMWKHFAVADKLIETRMLHRYGSGPNDWLYATYGWDPSKPNDPKAALAVLHGQPNAGGTLHDIPDPSACPACHGKLPERSLGFGAIELTHQGDGLNLQRLSDWGWLTVPARKGFRVPGTPVQQAALGYLHANCGGCHNSFGEIPRENPMLLRLLVNQTDYAQTDTVRTTIGVPTVNAYPELHGKPRIDPQSPATSAIYLRMSDRDKFPMPPLATKFPDTEGGVAAVTAWINSLPK